ncbi:MAG: beta-ketoacyl-ACP synthase III [Maricaulis sp.]|nr:beta-ketoacyl-ACP synthase III [Maricaulis sp.]
MDLLVWRRILRRVNICGKVRGVRDCIIRSVGWYAPEESISNTELVEVFNTWAESFNTENADAIARGDVAAKPLSSEEFIVSASGIENRHVIDKPGLMDLERMRPRLPHRPKEDLSVQAEFALKSARQALEKANRTAADIDGVIVASSAQQRNFPAVSTEIQAALGMEKGWSFDMTMACASAVYAMQLARDMIRAGTADAILICCPEIMSAINHYRRREVHFIFGDASGAVLLERGDREPGGWEILGTRLENSFSNALRSDFGFLNHTEFEDGDNFEPFVDQDGHRVFRDVIPMASGVGSTLIADLGLKPSDVRRAWLHQANIRIVQMVAKRVLEREPDADAAPIILNKYGNTSSSSVLMTFDMHSADMKAGERGLLCAFGAGYGCGAAVIQKR